MNNLLRIIAISSLVSSCENPFSPIGEYTPRLIVYSVISNTGGPQFVRVSSTYGPVGLSQDQQVPDTGLAGADVRIIAGGTTYVFRDSLLQSEDAGSWVNAYVCDSLPVVHGMQCVLEVRDDSLGFVRSTTTIPTAPVVVIPRETGLTLDNLMNRPLKFSVGLSTMTRRHQIRLFIEFETPDSVLRRWEVPLDATDSSFSVATYPGFELTDRFVYEIVYPPPSGKATYHWIVDKIAKRYTPAVKFRNMVIEVIQIGDLERYSSVVNGFRDDLSLRADEPDISNISGGFGYFGGFTRDEIIRPFPANFTHDPYHD
ncbi:MAG: DUF4249 family protein [Bacteroidota bacterium]